MQNRVYNFYM